MATSSKKLGNKEQDNKVLDFLRKKKYGKKTKKYKPLPDDAFPKCNESDSKSVNNEEDDIDDGN